MKILIADDHRLFAEGLKNLLESHKYEVVAIASDGREAVELTKNLCPDIIFMDIRMPKCDGLEATMLINLHYPETKIIMLTTSENDEDIYSAIKCGACGYFVKNIESEKLFELLDDIGNNGNWMISGLASKMAEDIKKSTEKSKKSLTKRQLEILALISKGQTYKEIAAQLGIRERTIKYHVTCAIEKVHLQNRQQLMSYVTRLGLID